MSVGQRGTIQEETSSQQGVVPAVQTVGTVDGTGRDRLGYGEVLALLSIGVAGAGGGDTLDVKLQESATVGGTYTDVPSGAFAQKLDTADNTISELYVNLRNTARLRFIRVRSVATGATSSFARSVELILADKFEGPAA